MDPLSTIAEAYTTPTQSQTPNGQERGDSDSQKRKRPSKEHQNQRKNPPDNYPPQIDNAQSNEPQMESVNQTQPPKTPSATRNHTPSADIITPNYNLPQFNKPHSPPLPPSLSSEAVKRRKILNQNHQNHQTRPATPAMSGKQPKQEQEQNMSVDEENTFPTDTRESSTQGIQGADGNGQDKDQPEQDTVTRPAGDKVPNVDEECSDDIFVEVDEVENAKTMARILNIDGSPLESYPLPPPHPHDKFIKGQMPKIFDKDPATLLAGMEREQLQSWLELPTGKSSSKTLRLGSQIQTKPQQHHQDSESSSQGDHGRSKSNGCASQKRPVPPQGRNNQKPDDLPNPQHIQERCRNATRKDCMVIKRYYVPSILYLCEKT